MEGQISYEELMKLQEDHPEIKEEIDRRRKMLPDFNREGFVLRLKKN